MLDSLEVNIRSHATLLAALGNEKRLQIMVRLLEEEQSVGVLARKVDLSQSALSQHLSKLRKLGLVSCRRQSQVVFYCTNDIRVRKIIDVLRALSLLPAHLTPKAASGLDAAVRTMMIAQMTEHVVD